MLAIHNIHKSYGPHTILNNISFQLHHGERVGLVGANGVGKSTLLKIITGEIEADAGTVSLPVHLAAGYLAQHIPEDEARTVHSLIEDSLAELRQMEVRMRELEADMGAADDLEAVMAEYGDLMEQFEQAGGYDIDYRVDVVLTGLRVAHIPRDRRFSTLSGGEKARVGLALLLLRAPDVLLLDEPTNHLDYTTLTWLEEYLQSYRGAMLIVSHDRHFLNRTVNAILEIDEYTRGIRRYTGDYDAYFAAKQLERRQWESDYARQQEEIIALRLEVKETARRNDNYRPHTDGDKLLRNAKKAKHEATISKRVRSAEEKLRRIEADPIPEPPDELRFKSDFDPVEFQGRNPLTAWHISKHYGARCVLEDVSLTIEPDSRIVLVGPNGAGKSTLLRLLLGLEQPDSGDIARSPLVNIGYLDQEQHTLPPETNVFEAYAQGLPGNAQQLKAILLSMGLLRYDDLEKRVGELSRGQQRKLQIARLIAGRANLLVLDEPTNDVSFDVLEGLESALKDFPGAVLAATHDRRFMQQFGGVIWELRDGRLLEHLDGYAAYMDSLEMRERA
ncbi:MAG: ABC-F family ATP-binding cassette domain-containing protein [Anaerolineae bacterium]